MTDELTWIDDGDDNPDSWRRKPWGRGWRKQQMLRDLAEAKLSQLDIARRYGVSQARVSQVANHPPNKQVIEEIRADIHNKFAGMWIAQKEARVAEYLAMVEQLDGDPDPAVVRARQAALRNVAEELAQLPNRVTVQHERKTVNYTVDGADPEDLK